MPRIEPAAGGRAISPPIEPMRPDDRDPIPPRLIGASGVIALGIRPRLGLVPNILIPPGGICMPESSIPGCTPSPPPGPGL